MAQKRMFKPLTTIKVTGYRYFVMYSGPQLHLSISPGIGRVERGVEYQVPEELYNSLKGLDGWAVRTEEVREQG